MHGEADDADLSALLPYDPGRFDAIHNRHGYVHEDDMGAEFLDPQKCFAAVVALANEDEVSRD